MKKALPDLTELIQSSHEKNFGLNGDGKGRIYCIRRSAVSESNNVIEILNLDNVSASPKLPKLGTGKCRSRYVSSLVLGL